MKSVLFICFFLVSAIVSAQEPPRSFSVIIIGGGPAGLSCATACAKMGFSTLCCTTEKKGIFCPDFSVTNWPGHLAVSWQKTLEDLGKDFVRHGGTIAATHVNAIVKNQGVFHLTTDMGVFHAPAIVMATGMSPPPVRYTVTTEHPTRILSRLFDDSFLSPFDSVIVVGNCESTLTSAIQSATKVKHVYLFLQPPWKSTGSPAERIVRKLLNITLIKHDKILTINSLREKATIEYLNKGSKMAQEASWIIFSEPWIPQSDLVRCLAKRDSAHAIITYDATGSTPTPGLFACGEVASSRFVPGIAAAADGLVTSFAVCQFLIDRGPLPLPRSAPQEETPPPPPPTSGETGSG